MGYFNRNPGVHRISLAEFDGSGEWVDIKASRSYGDRLRLSNAAVRLVIRGSGASQVTEPTLDMANQRMVLFETSIVAWSLRPDASETLPMPLKRESFEALDERLGEWLAEQIDGYYAARTVEEGDRGNSSAPSSGRSNQEALSLPS